MPNFIHSLDAANVHLLLLNISETNLPVYTIHDCFASTPNNMFILEKYVKEAFIEIYFKDDGYLSKLHKHFKEEIISATDTFIPEIKNMNIPIEKDISQNITSTNTVSHLNKLLEDNYTYVLNRDNRELIKIPNLPDGYNDKKNHLNLFIKGLLKSKYFIG